MPKNGIHIKFINRDHDLGFPCTHIAKMRLSHNILYNQIPKLDPNVIFNYISLENVRVDIDTGKINRQFKNGEWTYHDL